MFQKAFAILALLVFAGALALTTYWLALDQIGPPLEVLSSRTDKAEYRAGEMMRITRDICLNTLAPYTTHRAFFDHVVFSLNDFQTAAPLLGCHTVSLEIEIPNVLEPGSYTYRVWGVFRINPLLSMTVNLPDLHIKVIE